MNIIETFPPPATKADKLFWLPAYVRLSQSIWDTYSRTGETSERSRHLSNCASRWGVTRACAEAIITGRATINVTDDAVTVTRKVSEE